MQIITVNDDKYVVRGTVLADVLNQVTTKQLKEQWNADTVLRNGDTLYLVNMLIVAEYEDIN
jgi:hypothetical protein|tara:strand:- start:21 stop:206 length:186 start_codon:yes stop_codon:yes gene_type:complete